VSRDPLKWLRANGHALAPCTGQDAAAIRAAHALWELYAVADDRGRHRAIEAIRAIHGGALGGAMQDTTRHLICRVIPCALDWDHEAKLGPLVTGARP
jgi:hypothetical protein